MAMEKAAIKAEIKSAYMKVMNDTEGREASIDKVSDVLADAVMNAVKSITITYVSGLTSPMGPVTGTFQFTIE